MRTESEPSVKSERAGIYCRISTKDVRAPKVERQERDGRALCESAGYSVTGVYADDGISASGFRGRPGWEAMLSDIRAGTLDVLVATEEERFTRQVMEKETLQFACVAAGVTWHTVRGGKVDPATADGEFFSTLRTTVARMESRRKGERQLSQNAHRRATGEPSPYGARPFGYNDDKRTLREEEADLIRWATEHLIAGGGMYAVERRFNASGVKQMRSSRGWSHSSLRSLLVRGRNAGLVEYRGEEVPGVVGNWEPIVSREELAAVRIILSPNSGNGPTHAPTSLLGGVALCGCGAKMLRGHSLVRGVRREKYRCSGKGGDGNGGHASIKPEMLESAVRDAVVAAYVRNPGGNGVRRAESEALAALYGRRTDLRDAVDRVTASIASGTLTDAEAAPTTRALRAEASGVDAEIAAAASRSAHAAMVDRAHHELWERTEKFVDLADGTREYRVTVSMVESAVRGGEDPEAARTRLALGSAFDELPLESARNLVRALLKVRVLPGRGRGRVEISDA